jgi:hypothetical protein
MSKELEDEFCVVATFSNWLKILPRLIEKGYKPYSYNDGKGYIITYFSNK